MRSEGSVTGAYTYGPKLSWKANIDTDTCAQWAALNGSGHPQGKAELAHKQLHIQMRSVGSVIGAYTYKAANATARKPLH